jgi:hypothetical protein
MKELTVEEFEQKIAQVNKDLDELRKQGTASRKIEVLMEYKAFLEEDLRDARNKRKS